MSLEKLYGTRPDMLPRSLVKLTLVDEGSGRARKWIGRPGVELLALEVHLQYEQESLRRFPRNSDASIDWAGTEVDLLAQSMDADTSRVSDAIQTFMPNEGDLIFMWGSVVIPSLRMTKETTLMRTSEILETVPEFWIYSPKGRIMAEVSFSGALTVAKVPLS
ncbi:hypothetical protein ABZ729_32815 [Streptomyces sp. NPDC006678]|uniref:hypothetical protein n=1 Tax=Streptomyces sp. NPDC006678 TaxID=3157185 RepID=UPI0033F6902A